MKYFSHDKVPPILTMSWESFHIIYFCIFLLRVLYMLVPYNYNIRYVFLLNIVRWSCCNLLNHWILALIFIDLIPLHFQTERNVYISWSTVQDWKLCFYLVTEFGHIFLIIWWGVCMVAGKLHVLQSYWTVVNFVLELKYS